MMAKGAKAMDMTGKGIVVRELVDADGVLPPDDSDKRPDAALVVCGEGARLDLAETSVHDAAVVRVVRESWGRAQAGLVEILRFGALLITVRERLDAECFPVENIPQKGCKSKGQGLQGWLEKNCPEVNYNTAYGYMCAADGLRNMLRLADDVPLLPLMGVDPIPEKANEKLRKKMMKVIGASTLTLLKAAAREGSAGRPKGGTSDGRRALTADERTAAARQTLEGIVSSLGALITSTQARMIPLDARRRAATALKDYATRLTEE